jgi:hypothetical protein
LSASSDEFVECFESLSVNEQLGVERSIDLLAELGPALTRPYADTIRGSKFANMRELRTQVGGRPLRAFCAFDPIRTAIVLIGGDKTGDDRFCDHYIRIADDLYTRDLGELKRKGTHLMPTRPWSETRAKLKPGIVAQAKAEAEAIAVPLRALRKARDYTQDTIAEALGFPSRRFPR